MSGSRGDEGFVGGFEGLVFGLLLFIVGALFVSNAWAVIDTKFATDNAARQAARTYVQSSSAAVATTAAEQAADASLSGLGRDPRRATVSVVSGGFGRCQRVTVAVAYPAPLLVLPWLGRVGSAEHVRAQNSEVIDPYESGLPGAAPC